MLDDLAGEILAGLGYVAPISAPTNVAAAPADTPRTESASGRGLDAALDLEGFDGDAPMEIKADEAEIVSRDHGRELTGAPLPLATSHLLRPLELVVRAPLAADADALGHAIRDGNAQRV